ncbi:hypothetical protein CR513_42541, partial [Mucuna pruriens]
MRCYKQGSFNLTLVLILVLSCWLRRRMRVEDFVKFGHISYDYRERPKGLLKSSKTNPKGPRKFGKETPIMVLGKWVLTSHDRRIIEIQSTEQSQLCDSSYDVSFNKEECIVDNSKCFIIFSIKRQNNLYKIDLEDLTNQNITCLVSINDDQWTWHKKLGHESLRLISNLKKHNLVRGLPSLVYKVDMLCNSCQKGKQIKRFFESKNIVSNSKPLELLHIDLFEPTRTTLLGGKHYGLVMFLAHKDESFKVFSVFCKHIQNEKVLILLLSKVIMGENLKMKTFNSSVKNMKFIIIFSVQELLNGIVLSKGKNRSL